MNYFTKSIFIFCFMIVLFQARAQEFQHNHADFSYSFKTKENHYELTGKLHIKSYEDITSFQIVASRGQALSENNYWTWYYLRYDEDAQFEVNLIKNDVRILCNQGYTHYYLKIGFQKYSYPIYEVLKITCK